jgi:hypothetical protein
VDPVADLEAGFAAQGLHVADDVARPAFVDQRVVEPGVERDDDARLRLRGLHAVRRVAFEREDLGRQVVGPAREPHRTAAADRLDRIRSLLVAQLLELAVGATS